MTEGILPAVLAAMAFGVAPVITEQGLQHLSARAGARIAVPSVAILLWLLAPGFADARVLGSPALWIFAGVGLFFPAAVTLINYESNRIMGATVAGTLSSVAPLLSIGAGVILLGEAVTVSLVAGAVSVVAGIVLMADPRGSRGTWPRIAVLLPLAGAVLRALSQALTKLGLALVPSGYTAALVGFTVSSGVIWAVSSILPNRGPSWNLRGILWFLAVGLSNGSAVLALYGAFTRAPLTVVAPIVAGYPVFTLTFSAIWPRGSASGGIPRLRLGQAAGALLVVGGMVLVLA